MSILYCRHRLEWISRMDDKGYIWKLRKKIAVNHFQVYCKYCGYKLFQGPKTLATDRLLLTMTLPKCTFSVNRNKTCLNFPPGEKIAKSPLFVSSTNNHVPYISRVWELSIKIAHITNNRTCWFDTLAVISSLMCMNIFVGVKK